MTDDIARAIARTQAPAPTVNLGIHLPSGTQVIISLPLTLTEGDLIALMAYLPTALQQARTKAASSPIVVPRGALPKLI